MRTLRYFSMFSGIGGGELGIERAAAAHGIPVECVGYSEIDKNAIKTYERHWPQHVNFGDAAEIDPDDIPDFDLLVAGFPCQPFSIAGRQLGFEDTRGTLFFDIARILERKRPRHFILENVRNLVSHDKGRTFRVIVKALDELGYLVEWQVLNSKDFGVPQNRERIYLVGHLGGLGSRAVLPFAGEGHPHPPQRTAAAQGGVTRFGVVRNNFPGKPEVFVERPEGIATTIDANYAKGLDNHGARTGIAEIRVPLS